MKRTLNTIGRLSSYLNCNYDKRKRNSRCRTSIHHHYIIVHSYYQDKCACLCLCLYFGCHGKRSKVRTHVTLWHYARQYCPCLGLIKLPNRDRERGHNWSLMKWPPHQTAPCKSLSGWHLARPGHQSPLNHFILNCSALKYDGGQFYIKLFLLIRW